MIISSSQIQFSSQHTLLEYQQQRESILARRSGPQGGQTLSVATQQESLRIVHGEQRSASPSLAIQPSALPTPSPQGQVELPAAARPTPAPTVEANHEEDSVEDLLDLKTLMMKRFVEWLTGEEIELIDPRKFNTSMQSEQAPAPPPQAQSPWQIQQSIERTTVEMERSHFSAQGVVHTADGREIHLELELFMSRDFIQHSRVALQAGGSELKDPLVFNFNGHSAALTQTRYSFDLDADGKLNEIPFVGPNSGLLALDRNGDGVINDGSELFGALTGNGFAELARYDEDGNGWIDANDEVFSRLLIWSKDSAGNDRLDSLEERGIAAIYLGNTATPFSLKDAQNQLQGQVRASGIYLTAQAQVGSVQQIDFVV